MACRSKGTFMVRSVTFAVALALGTVSIPAHALGLGDIKAKSALNQEFRADIDLLSVAAGELDGVRVRLASPEEFKKAGIERPFFLTLLKFRPTRLKNGKTVIQVSSDFPIREPFLDFLVEVNWPKGRLIREYTVLLDPPVTTRRRAPKVSAAPAAAATSRAAPQRTASRRPVVQAGKGEYGPVASNETLWSIAKRLRPRGVSMEQMMIALLRANPDAFIDGDINRLRRGQVLRVPSSDEILSISRAEAHRAYKEAQEQWLNRRAARLQAQAGAAAAKGGKGAGGAAAAEAKSELRIATARPEGEGEAGASEDRGDGETIEEIKRKLLIARENAESSRLESEALRKEIEELRKRLADMQRLLVLKDEQLARLQAQTGQVIEPTEEESELSALESVMQEADKAAAAKQAEEEAAKAATGGQAEAGGETPAAEGETAESEKAAAGEGEAMPAEGEEKTPVVEGATGEEAPAAEGAAEEATAGEETLIVEEEGGAEEAPVVEDELAAAADAVLDEGAAEAQAPAAESAPATQLGAPTEAPTAEKEEAAPAPAPAPEAPAAEKPEAPKPAAPTPAAPEAEAPAEGGFDPLRFVQDNLPLVAGAGGVLALLLILLGLRRRSGGEEAAEETLAEATGMDQAKAEDDDIAGITEDSQLSHDEETSMLSEFSPSDVNALRDETGEVDPVAEADVYIAYGRYQQAEDLLKQAMERDPDRLALKHKLLEVYYATRNVAA
ncbi:MAG TPA: hypothetical protein ENJ94_08755, partial [Gammaproteobacteria bacterium]|nr:hypothetical protein [Gammaproteobacteria bacterium]